MTRNAVRDFVNARNIEAEAIRHHLDCDKSGNGWICPSCHSEMLTVDRMQNRMRCTGCGKTFDVFGMIQSVFNLDDESRALILCSSLYNLELDEPALLSGSESIEEVFGPELGPSQTAHYDLDAWKPGADLNSKPKAKNEGPPKIIRAAGAATYGKEQYHADIAKYSKTNERKTGFKNLDAIGAFRPGVYCVGAISSLGKSTWVLQLADNLAKTGEHVLFFSIEQSKRAMHAKSVSRVLYEMSGYSSDSPTATELMAGITGDEVRRAEAAYCETVGDRLEIIPCGSHLRPMDVTATVREFCQREGKPPVVVIDYVQRLQPDNPRASERAAMDNAVSQLQDLQLELGCTVMAVSSLNRSSYLQPISFESVKESGGIEFTADVFWGLELGCMRAPMFEDEKGTVKKREIINAAKKETPREVRLVCLKNRDGNPIYDALFYYDARHNYFWPVPENEIAKKESGEIDFPAKNGGWRGMLKGANVTTSRPTKSDPAVITYDDVELTGQTIRLTAEMVKSWDAGTAHNILIGLSAPKDRTQIRNMRPSEAKASLLALLKTSPKRFATYTDTPEIPRCGQVSLSY